MASKNLSQSDSNKKDASNQMTTFNPVIYTFRTTQQTGREQAFALQQPFATLFDNLITVLWVVYYKKTSLRIGINQLQWALQFMQCMKVDNGYPESIGKIVSDLENQLITLYAMVGKVLKEKKKSEVEIAEKDVNEKSSISSGVKNALLSGYKSYNEEDIMKKLDTIDIVLDPVTGEPKNINDLHSLAKRKAKSDKCPIKKNSSKIYVIGALQNVMKKTTDAATKTEVEKLIKELKLESQPAKKTP
ncbi:Hypothetical protein CINCED_3A018569 [Cinara cedri]|uniref:Uncharacterized protein n=1 Tax=Cinara cedri TaxID=506608 RepID=A0A5E4M6M4_9HEMI|nr:Hypothetical protein CINCED_3A018569 [Cinara cedri]